MYAYILTMHTYLQILSTYTCVYILTVHIYVQIQPKTVAFQKGLGQHYVQPAEEGFNVSLVHNRGLMYYHQVRRQSDFLWCGDKSMLMCHQNVDSFAVERCRCGSIYNQSMKMRFDLLSIRENVDEFNTTR